MKEKLLAIQNAMKAWLEEIRQSSVSFEEKYEPIEYVPSDNEMKIIETLDNSCLPELGVHHIFIASCVLGRASGFIVAPRGKGKSKVLHIVHKHSGLCSNPQRFDEITEVKGLSMLSGKRTEVYVDDFSNMIERKEILSVCATLVTQGEYTVPGQVTIENADASFWFAIQPNLLAKLMNMDIWSSMVVDRFPRYWMFYFHRPNPPRFLDENEFPEVKGIDVYQGEVHSEIPDSELIKIDFGQMTPERTLYFIKKVLVGHARLCGRDTVTVEDDLDWFKLYLPFFEVEKPLVFKSTEGWQVSETVHAHLFEYLLSGNVDMSNEVQRGALISFCERTNQKWKVVSGQFQIIGRWFSRLKNLFQAYGYVS
jgi:hypothetical protein